MKRPARKRRSAPRKPEEIQALRARLEEAEETLRAIREGEVDAIVVSGSGGERVFSLTGAETVYRLIVETMKEAALTVSLDGQVLFCNAQFSGFVGMPLDQVIGRPLTDFVVNEGRTAIGGLLRKSRRTSVKARVVFQGPAGGRVPAHVSASVLRQKDGVSICIVATDLTELEMSTEMLRELRRQQDALAESEERYRTLVEMDPDALAVHQEGKWVYVNPAGMRLFGVTRPDQIMGKSYLGVVHPADRKATQQRVQELRKGPFVPLPLRQGRLLRQDGTSVAMESTSAMITYRGAPAVQMVIRDVSERERAERALKRSEEALREAKGDLERRVAARTARLRQMVALLRDEMRRNAQGEKQIRAAHEQLSTRADQLRSLAGQLTVAERRERQRLAKILHDHLQQLLVASKYRLAGLAGVADETIQKVVADIEGLLDKSIAASRDLTAELYPPVLHEKGLRLSLEWLTRWMAETHGLSVDLAMPAEEVTLPEDVRILAFESVRELLFNAVKHARVTSARVELCRSRNASWEIVVSDKGRGFDPEEPSSNGGGFGLFGVRERLQLIGGSLRIASSPGHGSRFTITLPRAAREETSAVGQTRPARPRVSGPPASRAGQTPPSLGDDEL